MKKAKVRPIPLTNNLLGPVRRERKAGQLFRLAAVSHIKMVVLQFRNGQKRSLCMGERNGTVPAEQALMSHGFHACDAHSAHDLVYEL